MTVSWKPIQMKEGRWWHLKDGMYAYIDHKDKDLSIFFDKEIWKDGIKVATLDDHFDEFCYPSEAEAVLFELEYGETYPLKLVRRLMGHSHYRTEISLWFKSNLIKLKDLCNNAFIKKV